jgi:hypothetical protein
MLSIKELFEHGQTLNYSELPEALWAATGYRMRNSDRFLKFGILRNGLVHFAAPQFNAAAETFKFAFEVIDPMLQDFWCVSFLEYCQYEDDVIVAEGYLREQIEHQKVTVHPETMRRMQEIEGEYRSIYPDPSKQQPI